MSPSRVGANSAGAAPPAGWASRNDAAPQPGTSAPATATARAASATPKRQEVARAVNDINHALQSLASRLEFSINENTDGITVKVVDTGTNQVIREFSPGKVLGIALAVGTVQGLLLRESA